MKDTITNNHNENSLVIGVDGGGSKTACVVLDISTRMIQGRSQAGGSNQNCVGRKTADENILKSIQEALIDAEKELKHVEVVCLCLAGVGNQKEETAERIKLQLQNQELKQTSSVIVYNDSAAGLSSGTNGQLEGIVLIAGTGTIACGRKGDREVYAQGWGPAFSDQGSAYDLGQQGLAAVAKNVDGIGPKTSLTQAILDHFEIEQQDLQSYLINYVYKDTTWAPIANLAPLVLQCAAENDDVALGIIQRGVNGLLNSILAVANELNWKESKVPIVLVGGLFKEDTIYRKQLKEYIEKFLPSSDIILPNISTAEGAALIAIQQNMPPTNGY